MKNTLISVLVFVLFASCSKKVEKIQPSFGRITESVYASGFIKSKNQYQVFSTVNGILLKMLVKEGDIVKKGDPLFIIQNEVTKLNAENAQLAADFASANVNGDRLRESKSNIESARSKMLNDSMQLERQRALWKQQIGSRLQVEQLELAFTTSTNNYNAAQYRYSDLKKQLKLNAEQSKKQLSISNNMMQDYTVRSLSNGKVYQINKDVGELVNTQSPLAIIGDANDFIAELQIDETDIVSVKLGQSVFLTMDSYKNQVFEAKIAKLYPLMNERTRTFTAEAEFVVRPPVLYPNLSAETNILIRSKENAMIVPRAYLLEDSLLILENKERVKVKTGLKDYQKVEIISGIQGTETLIKPEK
ncbi:MAG: efflux RND transporter periplasmic adaptor subunit [Saprospiraceae bacterium]